MFLLFSCNIYAKSISSVVINNTDVVTSVKASRRDFMNIYYELRSSIVRFSVVFANLVDDISSCPLELAD